MWKIMVGVLTGGLIAAYSLGTPLSARAEEAPQTSKPAAPAKKARQTQFQGTLKALDKIAMTITVEGKKAERTFRLTSRTRLYKGGKPATLDAAVAGEPVSVHAKRAADGQWDATSVRFGPKSERGTKPKKEKKTAPEQK
ncbi:MAG: DUF5666 domain-containing protein [Limisphaerales bacterium]